MRARTFVMMVLAAGTIGLPARASAQVRARVQVAFGARLGPEISVFAYSADRYGAWRTSYRRWTPVTIYDVNGHYFRYGVAGARAIVVYRYKGEYFMPPQDKQWIGFDARYTYNHRPTDVDAARVAPYAPVVVVDPRLGAEIAVWAYSADRAGPWRRNYRRWTPVRVYEFRGHYYPHAIAGARAIELYRYRNEYFLPPHEAAWVGADRRFDYRLQPDADDFARAREHP